MGVSLYQSAEETLREEFDGLEIPKHIIVCPDCGGKGRTLTASLRGDVTDMVREDPDFAEDYFGGAYDETCRTCGGRNVIEEADYERLPADAKARFEELMQEEIDYRRCVEAERRMGC